MTAEQLFGPDTEPQTEEAEAEQEQAVVVAEPEAPAQEEAGSTEVAPVEGAPAEG